MALNVSSGAQEAGSGIPPSVTANVPHYLSGMEIHVFLAPMARSGIQLSASVLAQISTKFGTGMPVKPPSAN